MLDILRSKNVHIAGAIHAAEHVLLSLASTAGDVRTECKPAEKEFAATKSTRKRPARWAAPNYACCPTLNGADLMERLGRLTLYDAAGQSGGICAKAFDRIGTLLIQAADRVIECGCADGCPRCKSSLNPPRSRWEQGTQPGQSYLTVPLRTTAGIASSQCSQANIVTSKLGAMIVLQSLTGRDMVRPSPSSILPAPLVDVFPAQRRTSMPFPCKRS